MVKILIISCIGFGLSLGLTSGIIIAKQPALKIIEEASAKKTAEADSLRDSTADTTVVLAAEFQELTDDSSRDSVADILADKTLLTEASLSEASLLQKDSAALRLARASAKSSTDSGLVTRVAKVFSSMTPNDAARILAAMEDTDIQSILAQLPKKQQASILSQLPTDRAALLTRASIRRSE